MQQAQLGDAGVRFLITLVDVNNVPIDVSSSSVSLLLERPNNGGLKSFSMSFVDGGTGGMVQYTTADGDLDTVGTWRFQVRCDFTAGPLHSTIDKVKVKDNLG